MQLTPEQRIENIKQRISDINTKKVQAQAQLQILQQNYDQKLNELKQLGINNVDNVDISIVNLENELNNLLFQTEQQLTDIESQLNAATITG